jgi:EAL domain-containing protein (putative c-di-GMP-specific phosphodiesterase class I)
MSKAEDETCRDDRVESLHLTGPLPAVRRLALLAAQLGVTHEVSAGVLHMPLEAASPLIDGAHTVLAPLEAMLVHVVRTDLASGTPESMLAVACSSPTLAQLAARRKHRRLLEAIHSRQGVTIGFQQIVDLATGRTQGFEALLRVRLGSTDVPPGDVLSAAEEAGRLVEVDATARSVALREAAASIGERVLFVNVLPSSLPVPVEQLAPFVAEVAELGLDPSRIVLEAPVGPAGSLRRQVDAVFRAARESGFRIGLDNVRNQRDLGAIDVLPDYVKLDRSLVRGLPSPSGTRSLGAIVRDCQHSGATLIAQGIETPEHLKAVRELGVRYAQGWALGRPGAITSEAPAVTA